jgi:hypothetical protein
MKIVAVAVAIVAALASGPAMARKKAPQPAPYVVYDREGFDRGADNGSPAYGRLISVANPKKRSVVVTVGCDGNALLNLSAVVGPGRSVVFDVGTDGLQLRKGQCGLRAWRVWDGKPVEQ